MNSQSDFWHVRLPNGSVHTLTLDELDAAFQAGQIDESVYVLQHGATSWTTLGILLGIEAAPPAPPVRVPSVVVAPQAPAPAYSFAPYASPPDSAPFSSLRPMVSEVDVDDLDFKPRFRSSGKRKVLFAFGIAAVAVVGFAVANPNRAASTWARAQALITSSNASAASPPVAAAAPPPAPDPIPPPAAQPEATPPPPASPPPATQSTLSDDKKKALLDADKARAAQHQAKAAAAPAHRSNSYKSDGKTVFHKGGDKYDPLNSSL